MKFNLKNKGFSFSPYLMIVMMFLGIIMAFHFMIVDTQKAAAIAEEGSSVKNALQVEGVKSSARNVILLSAYDYIYIGLNRPDQQAPGYSIKDPVDKGGGLKGYLQKMIKLDLNNVWSENHWSTVSWDKVEILEEDENGEPIKEGFIVRAEGSYAKVEKFVDANVFKLYKYANDENSDYWRSKFHYKLKGLIAYKMQRTLSGVRCEVDSIWNPNPLVRRYETGVVCRSSEYTDSDPDENEFCTDSPYQTTWGDRSSDCWEDRDVKPFMRDATETGEKIKDALIDVQRTIAMGDSNYIKALRDDNITVKLDIKKVTIDTTVKCTDGVWCCNEGKSDCLQHDQDWLMSFSITGKISVEETMISQAEIKEDDSTQGSFEICYENPIMKKNGEVIPLTVKKEYDIPYGIYVNYRLDCHPDYLTIKRNHDCEPKKTSATLENIMTFTDKEDSLKYTLETPECAGGSIHPHVGGPDTRTGGAGIDQLTTYKGGSYISQCYCYGPYHLE